MFVLDSYCNYRFFAPFNGAYTDHEVYSLNQKLVMHLSQWRLRYLGVMADLRSSDLPSATSANRTGQTQFLNFNLSFTAYSNT